MKTGLVLLLALLSAFLPSPLPAQIQEVRISLLYDNNAARADMTQDWGFSCLVQCDERTLLFDTGAKPEILLQNMKALGADPAEIDAIVISHEHMDHLGGIYAFTSQAIPALYLPKEARIWEMTSAAIGKAAADRVVVSDLLQIAPYIWISKPLGGICFEQSLLIDSREGLVVIVGCAHPGIVTMLKDISLSTGRPIYALIGGLHLLDCSAAQVQEAISQLEALNLQKICACHCTGEKAIASLAEAFRDRFFPGGVGAVLQIASASPRQQVP